VIGCNRHQLALPVVAVRNNRSAGSALRSRCRVGCRLFMPRLQGNSGCLFTEAPLLRHAVVPPWTHHHPCIRAVRSTSGSDIAGPGCP
jgi:hypothetical protein